MSAAPVAYRCPDLLVGGRWRPATGDGRREIVDPADGAVLDTLRLVGAADLEDALRTADTAFRFWRKVPAHERCARLERGVARIRADVERIATLLTLEQGKPLAEARAECLMAADLVKWYAEEARRAYGRIVPARAPDSRMDVHKLPVGPVAAFAPWNFPLVLSARKLGGALAAGCSIVLKGAEETPAALAAFVDALAQELPAGVVQLVYGEPAQVSTTLIASPVIRKVSFTGSVPVGRALAQLAGQHLKRITLELGGHAPAIVCADADLDRVVPLLAQHKFRNAGQACLAPTRFLVARPLLGRFVDAFDAAARALRLGPGLDPATTMGPLANARRQAAVRDLVARSRAAGARVLAGDAPVDGCFVPPTLLVEPPPHTPALHEEPFGPVACIQPFDGIDEAIALANRSDYGLAGYLYTDSARTIHTVSQRLQVGALAVNGIGVSVPEAPFGGCKDSGHGSESGIEGLEAFHDTRFMHYNA
jgi:acyl-CoA reductase-like NAD-dependent aldehyde dehydrogenase